jgi:hypothetical protein
MQQRKPAWPFYIGEGLAGGLRAVSLIAQTYASSLANLFCRPPRRR